MITILISETFLEQVDPALLERAAQAALRHASEDPDQDCSIVVEDDAYLQALNKEYLGIDAPTDVLSFPSGEELPDPETERYYLGDVIISYPRAVEQAAATRETVPDELQLLVVHGVLHLLGHDHAEPAEKALMWKTQAEVLNSLGVRILRLPE